MSYRQFVVTGRVQGVGFRAYTRQRAHLLGLTGSAVNQPDGSVLISAYGSDDALDGLRDWLHGGATPGHVAGVREHAISESGTPPTEFTTG